MSEVIAERTSKGIRISGPTPLITDAVAYLTARSSFSLAWIWDIQPNAATIEAVLDQQQYTDVCTKLREWAAFLTRNQATVEGRGNRIVLKKLPES